MNYTKIKQECNAEQDAKREQELNELYLEEMQNIGIEVLK
jgi:hypothetical protein